MTERVADSVVAPDPFIEMRMTALHATRGANYWSRCPVTRWTSPSVRTRTCHPLAFQASLARWWPRCRASSSILLQHWGARRLHLAPAPRHGAALHIVEHVALELQGQIGHDVVYGRTRGGDVPGEYTVVFEHVSDVVGLRAAALAFDTVQRAFAGTLESVEPALAELRALAAQHVQRLTQHVRVASQAARYAPRREPSLARRGVGGDDGLVVDVAPGYILQVGPAVARSDVAIVLDDEPTDVPERYRDPERAARLVSVVADAVRSGGVVIAPASAWDVQDRARDAGCRVAVFAPDDSSAPRDRRWRAPLPG